MHVSITHAELKRSVSGIMCDMYERLASFVNSTRSLAHILQLPRIDGRAGRRRFVRQVTQAEKLRRSAAIQDAFCGSNLN